jgi:antitoxin FitA
VAKITIRDLDEDIRAELCVRAARHGRSMEAEVREILREAVQNQASTRPLGTRITQRFASIGGAELTLPTRAEPPRLVEARPVSESAQSEA